MPRGEGTPWHLVSLLSFFIDSVTETLLASCFRKHVGFENSLIIFIHRVLLPPYQIISPFDFFGTSILLCM